jgi:hypothetical protein
VTNTRGIVVGVNSSGSTETVIAIDGRIDGEDLRRYVLYWDQIDYPYIDGLGGANIDGQPELALLRDSGCLITSAINLPEPPEGWNAFGGIPIVPGIPFNQQIDEVRGFLQIEAAEMHNASGGQLWSIAQSGVDLQLPGVASTLLVQTTEFIQSIEVALHDSLPVPDASSNLEAVLAFKENRRSELLCFRNAMDNYDAIEKSESKA